MNINENYLIDIIDREFVCKLPYDNNAPSVAEWARKHNIINLTGLGLIRFNVTIELQRLWILEDQKMINSTSSYIWKTCITSSQKEKFTALANKANNINHNIRQINAENLNRIFRLNMQDGDIPLFNGISFYDNDGGFDSFLPAGTGNGSSSF